MRFSIIVAAGLAGMLFAEAASAEIVATGAEGFVIENRAVVRGSPAAVYDALGRIGSWWNSAHTYSGQATNLRLGLRAGDCFCETWAGGSVEHGRVVQARPASLLRLSAALGPLQAEAVSGTLTWTLRAAPGGTEIVQRYVVGGYVAGGAGKYARPVEQVMAEQLRGLQSHLAK